MARATVELDFFGLEKESSSSSSSELLKSVNGSASTSVANHGLFSPLPLFRPVSQSVHHASPMTIFYNGTVVVFDVSRPEAESIMKLAAQGKSEANPTVAISSTHREQLLLVPLSGDLPIARKWSIQRFLEKRKERLVTASPYACPHLT